MYFQALVTINNTQMYRSIMTPGWTLGWMWAKKEVIWSIVGAQATDQGDCSKFKNNIPHCCRRNPVIVDLLPGVPMNQQFIYIVAKVVNSPLGAKTLPQLFLHFSYVLDFLVPQIKQWDFPRIFIFLVQDLATHAVLRPSWCPHHSHLMVGEKLMLWVSYCCSLQTHTHTHT